MKRTRLGAFLFGMGLTGMIDGIVFHQLLQWHSTYMWTTRHNQIVSDGLLHVITTAFMVAGTSVLWLDDTPNKTFRNRSFWGALLLGGGIFNLFEGVINHHVLQIHHVRPGPLQAEYDIAFDLAACCLVILGIALSRMHRLTTD
ncbi:membrane protein [Alicyclobacillus hesperidum]|uniref:Membrane protein n=1 Tax=Alicyclobacillus hesperidum TaxID=89784 RepID=A0A1H2V914_9BACL|nr:DUF2243 domain-containing protein [Alicyclobacillus hesperidum]GLV14865.1 membrane protein [Alicyclobacillus hesperidum]SDW64868.1 Uncharacterized membrane protein [Alicyclobacillus hesperidum]